MSNTNLFRDIPDFQPWLESSKSETEAVENYVAFNHKVKHLIMSLTLIRPRFVEIDGMILRADGLPKDAEEYIRRLQKDANWSSQQIEYAVNHLHLDDHFYNDADSSAYSLEILNEIAHIILEIWKDSLAKAFPNHIFVAGINSSDSWPGIYIHQSATQSPK